jgi:hypothetical protein
MRRRSFLTLLGAATAAWPVAAQQAEWLPTIGFLGPSTPSAVSQWVAGFVQRLRTLWIEGRTVAIDTTGQSDTMSATPRLRPSSSDMEEAIMSKTITKEDIALLVADASEMFNETGCVPAIDGEEVPAERMVPHAKQYISETIDDSKALFDSKIWDTPGFTLVLSWLSQKWLQKCQKLAPRGTKNPDQHLSKEQQNECLDSAAAELIREITQRRQLN